MIGFPSAPLGHWQEGPILSRNSGKGAQLEFAEKHLDASITKFIINCKRFLYLEESLIMVIKSNGDTGFFKHFEPTLL